MSKPTFVFAEMQGCGHCVNFKKNIWPLVLADNSLKQAVNLRHFEWGRRTRNGGGGLPKGYEHIRYGPYFQLEIPGRPFFEMKGVSRPRGNHAQSAKNIRDWILKTLKDNPPRNTHQPNRTPQRNVQTRHVPKQVVPSRRVNTRNVQQKSQPIVRRQMAVKREIPPHVQNVIDNRYLSQPAGNYDAKTQRFEPSATEIATPPASPAPKNVTSRFFIRN